MALRMPTKTKVKPKDQAAIDTSPDPTAAARARVEQLHQVELKLTDELATTTATLQAAERATARQVVEVALGGGEAVEALGRLTVLRTEIAVTSEAIDEARRQRREAVSAVWVAEAEQLRQRAAALRAEADEREPRTRELLAALEAHEGCTFAPVRSDGPAPFPHGLNTQGGALNVIVNVLPRTQMLRLEADQIEQQAAALAQRTVQDAGMIEATSADELIARLREVDPFNIGPRLDVVETWARAAEDRHQARIARIPTVADAYGRATVALRLVWVDGAIDERRSRATVPALDE